MKSLPPAAIGVGLLLLVGSATWPALFPATRMWTNENSRRLKELSAKEQVLLGKIELSQYKPNMTGGENPAVWKEKVGELKQERESLQAVFASAHDGPQKMSALLKWSGVGILALGIVGYMATKDA